MPQLTPDVPRDPSKPGFSRDEDLEETRAADRPARSDLSSTRAKAEQEPTIDYAPDPDAEDREG